MLDSLVAATGPDHHVAVFLEDDVGAVIKVEHRDGVELCGGTAGLGNRVGVDKMNLRRKRGEIKIVNNTKKVIPHRVIH